MSTFSLKLLAIITMVIDHIGVIFISPATHPQLYLLFRGIGRLAFPIFVFLVVEGYFHTGNVKNYLKRLGIFALLSEIPYDLAFYQVHFNRTIIKDFQSVFANGFEVHKLESLMERLNQSQNVFFTLFMGLLLIYLMNIVEIKLEKKLWISNILDVLLIIGFCVISLIIKIDYDIAGMLLFVTFYLFRGSKVMISFCLFIISATVLSNLGMYQRTGDLRYVISLLATFAMLPIAFYNGKKGKNIKYIFYIFYPAHLMILFLFYTFYR